MTVIYRQEDGDLQHIGGRTIGIIGYGNMGRPAALNLRDSGLNVIVGVHSEAGHNDAVADGIRPLPISQIPQMAEIMFLLLPDEVMPQVYLEQISPRLQRGHTLLFASGYNVAFGFIEAPPFIDVGLIAPRAFGPAIRERYLSGEGFYSFVAVGQDATTQAWPTVLAVAAGMGALQAGALEVTMEQEAQLDLFVQQAVLPAVHHIITTAARLLVRLGYPPEAAIMDLYISGEFTDYIRRAAEEGLNHALRLSSLTGRYGLFSRLERFNELKLERLMEITMEEIAAGRFAQEWAREYANDYPRLRKLLAMQERDELWELEQQTIELLRGL